MQQLSHTSPGEAPEFLHMDPHLSTPQDRMDTGGAMQIPGRRRTCIPAEAPSRCNCQGFKPRRSSQDGNSDHRLGFPAAGLRCAGKNVWHARNRQRVYLLGPHGPIPCLSQSQKVKYPISTPVKTQVSTWQHFSVSHHPPIPQNHRPLLGRLLQ